MHVHVRTYTYAHLCTDTDDDGDEYDDDDDHDGGDERVTKSMIFFPNILLGECFQNYIAFDHFWGYL